MEASALELRRGTAQGKGVLTGSLLRLRSDEQLVGLFRAGEDEAFRVIHDRYRRRLLAYMMQMLNGSVPDAEDALQDVFERAYCGLRAHQRELALRAWLYRVAHNRCVDQLRRPAPLAAVDPDETESRDLDPFTVTQRHETLRRLILDISRLPEHQRSALLLREMSGMSYSELSEALGVSVPAVKSLLVRARIGLAAAAEARDTACSVIREELVAAYDSGTRPDATARRHLRDCAQCRHFRRSMRSVSRNLAAVTPALGPLGLVVKLLGGGGAAGGGMAGSGVAGSGGGAVIGASSLATTGGAIGTTSALTSAVAAGGASHVAAIVAAALVTAGGAVAVQPSAPPVHHPVQSPAAVRASSLAPLSTVPAPGAAAAGTAGSVAAAAGTGTAGGAGGTRAAQDPPNLAPQRHPAGAGRSSTATPGATSSAPPGPGAGASSTADPTGSTGSTSSTSSTGSTASGGSSTSTTASTVTTSSSAGSSGSTTDVAGTSTGGSTSAAPSSSTSSPSSTTGSSSDG